MRKLTIILYVLSICHWAGAQQVYTYLLTDGWHAAKAFDYGNDTCVIVGLISDPDPSEYHRFHFTTINAVNEVLDVDTFKLSDTDYASYQSPFGVSFGNDRLLLNGFLGSEGFSFEFNKKLKLEQNKTISYGTLSAVYGSINTADYRQIYYGGYQDGTRGNTVQTYLNIISENDTIIKIFNNENLLSNYGNCITLPNQIIQASNSSFLLVNTLKPVALTVRGISQGLVIKVDSLGREQWRLPIWEDSTSVYNLVVAPMTNGNYLAVYQDLYSQPYMSAADNYSNRYPAPNQKSVAWFVEFDEDGQILRKWNIRKELENKRGVQDRYWTSFSHFLVEQDGSILLVGSSRDNGKYGYDVGFLLKLDGNGKYQWYRQYEISINKPYTVGKENIFCYGVTHLAKGGYALAGEYRSDPSDSFPAGTQRGLVLFVDSFGCLEPGCEVNDKIGIDEVQAKQEYFTVYPNPSNGNIQITSSNNQKPDKIEVFDMQGRVVHFTINDPFTAPSSTLHCPAGVYYLKIYRTDGYYETHKIIIQ
jgi:hypothetical protein